MTKDIPEHRDVLGQPLAVGDAVVYPSGNTMYVGVITKFNPKMVKVKHVGAKRGSEYNKYPTDVARVSGPDVTLFLLKAGHNG